MRHLSILSEPHGEQGLKYSRQLELYKLGCRVSGGAQPQEMAPVLLAKYGVEERKGGSGGRGGAHPVRLSESPMIFSPESLIRPSPNKAQRFWLLLAFARPLLPLLPLKSYTTCPLPLLCGYYPFLLSLY